MLLRTFLELFYNQIIVLDLIMKRQEKERKPIIFKVNLEGGVPSLDLIREDVVEPVQNNSQVSEIQDYPEFQEYQEGAEQEVFSEVQDDAETFSQEQPTAEGLYLNCADQVTGPFTEKELRRRWGYGVLKAEDQVWCEDRQEWIALALFFGTPTIDSLNTRVDDSKHLTMIFSDDNAGKSGTKILTNLAIILSLISMVGAILLAFVNPSWDVTFITTTVLGSILALAAVIISRKPTLILLFLFVTFMPIGSAYYLNQQAAKALPVKSE